MEIVEKKVETIYYVEINFEEFWEAASNLVADVKTNRAYFLGPQKKIVEAYVLKEWPLTEQQVTFEQARDMFIKSSIHAFSPYIIKYIAESNGYSIQNYGCYYEHENLIKCSFERTGMHM